MQHLLRITVTCLERNIKHHALAPSAFTLKLQPTYKSVPQQITLGMLNKLPSNVILVLRHKQAKKKSHIH